MIPNFYRRRCGRLRLLLMVAGLFSLHSTVLSQQPDIPKSAAFDGHVHAQQPNYLLPNHVTAPDGELTFFADFKHPDGGRIPIYVVNRTREAAKFASQDGDIYLKLEAQMPDGHWQRAQSHESSWCGNSYFSSSLPAGQFWLFGGYQPTDGHPAKVRFAIHGDEERATNVGDGLVSEVDLADANKDSMTGGRVPFMTALLMLDEVGSNARENSWSDRVAILRLVARWEDNGFYRAKAEKVLQAARADGSKDGIAAANAIGAILATRWPTTANPAAFVSQCIEDLRLPANAQSVFGSVRAAPAVVWKVLHDLAEVQFVYGGPRNGPLSMKLADWREVMDTARQRVDASADYAVTDLVAIPALADEFVEDRFFEERLSSPGKLVRKMATETLGRRGRFDRLVELGRGLPSAYQVEILAALADSGPKGSGDDSHQARYPAEGAETAFWAACVREQPIAAMAALSRADDFGRGNSVFPSEVEAAAQAFLRAEAQNVGSASGDFKLPPTTDFNVALRFLANRRGWRYEPAVLEKLLAHGGYNEMESWSAGTNERWEIHRFPVRDFALGELKKLGIEPKQPVEIEKRFPLPARAPAPVDPTKPL